MKNFKGSESFLCLLEDELSKYVSNDNYKIATPSILTDINKVDDVSLIARFDGITHYKFTPTSIYLFLKQRKFSFLPVVDLSNIFGNKSLLFFDRIINKYLSRVEIQLRKTADIIVYQSQFSKEIHEFLLGKVSTKSVIIPNGILVKEKSCATLNDDLNQVNAVITAHFRLGKRLRDAIKICNYANSFFPMKLHIIGGMDFLTEKSISDISLENCVFYGSISQSKSFEIYKNMHIGLAPSINESCSNSVLEMMSTGIPVLVTSNGGSKEIVPGDDFIVDEGDEDNLCFIEYHNPFNHKNEIYYQRWVDKISIVLAKHDEYSKLTHNHVNKNYSIELIASKYLEIINEFEAR